MTKKIASRVKERGFTRAYDKDGNIVSVRPDKKRRENLPDSVIQKFKRIAKETITESGIIQWWDKDGEILGIHHTQEYMDGFGEPHCNIAVECRLEGDWENTYNKYGIKISMRLTKEGVKRQNERHLTERFNK